MATIPLFFLEFSFAFLYSLATVLYMYHASFCPCRAPRLTCCQPTMLPVCCDPQAARRCCQGAFKNGLILVRIFWDLRKLPRRIGHLIGQDLLECSN